MRLRKVKTTDELEDLIDDYQIQSFKIKEKSSRHAIMRKSEFGTGGMHTLYFLLTFWWTLGLGNLCYSLYAYFWNSKEIMIKKTYYDT